MMAHYKTEVWLNRTGQVAQSPQDYLLKYKELKSILAIEEFSGATTTSVFQEFYINMLLSNLSSLIKIKLMKRLKSQPKAQINIVIRQNVLLL